MKKLTPFVFPLIVLIIVMFLLYRWYQMRTAGVNEKLSLGEGIEIEDLSNDELNSVMRGGESVKTVELQPEQSQTATATDNSGVIRYEVLDNKVAFSVMTELPTPEKGMYQVWVKEGASQEFQKAFTLEMGKGGYMGYAAVSADLMPFEVIVTMEQNNDDTMEQVLLKGTVEKPVESN